MPGRKRQLIEIGDQGTVLVAHKGAAAFIIQAVDKGGVSLLLEAID